MTLFILLADNTPLSRLPDRAGSLHSTPRGLSPFPERNRKEVGVQGPAS